MVRWESAAGAAAKVGQESAGLLGQNVSDTSVASSRCFIIRDLDGALHSLPSLLSTWKSLSDPQRCPIPLQSRL